MGDHTGVGFITAVSVFLPVAWPDMDLNIAGDLAPFGAEGKRCIKKVRTSFEVPTAGVFNEDFFSSAGLEFSWPERGVEPDALQVSFRVWKNM